MPRRSLAAALLLIAIFAPVVLSGCATVAPPPAPADGVPVYLADYGRHASLILPDGDGLTEFAFGEWRWFALEDNWLIRAPRIMLLPAPGTLGRRRFGPVAPPVVDHLAGATGGARILTITVTHASALALATRLEHNFDTAGATPLHNADYEMDFVPAPRLYWLPHNCNNQVAAWLREMGCRVSTPVVFSAFTLAPTPPPPAPPQPGAAAVSRPGRSAPAPSGG